MSQAVLRSYLTKIQAIHQAGNATEHSYRPDCRDLLQAIETGITATNDPKHVECGAPDYIITRSTGHGPVTIGYVEAKDIGISLDKTEKSEQLDRYRRALPNLILTDYVEFRWYVDGNLRDQGRIATIGSNKKLTWDTDGAAKVEQLLHGFLNHSAQPISQPHELAERMARLAHFIRDRVVEAFDKGKASTTSSDLYQAFKDVLIPDLKVSTFADMFAQTLAYGLFAARYNHQGNTPFQRLGAAHDIPKTNPFLRQLFATITGPNLDSEPYIDFVNDLAQLLAMTDMDAVLADFGRATRQEDPVVHFYETFLSAYDPKLREKRGVYYTPEPVVSYLVRSVHHLLKSQFAAPNGLADTKTVQVERLDEQGKPYTEQFPHVMILDPACGTGTFSYMIIKHIRDDLERRGQAGAWSTYVRKYLLPRLFSFELLMAPYAVAHLKLGMQLAALDLPPADRATWRYDFQSNDRLGIFLTNTLEEAAKRSQMLMGRYISDEANEAAKVKKDFPVMVVIGNPPYSGESANKGEWITNLMRGREMLQGKDGNYTFKLTHNYFEVDGRPLKERNPKWLNDDYVKFIRFAQWRIEQTGYGVLAFITNHRYLTNVTFRGMRQSLMRTFDEIYLLDLHGNSNTKERAPDGGKEENVFDIQQGVAIGIFVRKQNGAAKRAATVYHADLWGNRAGKYGWLTAHDVSSTPWTPLSPQSTMYHFAPRNMALQAEFQKGWRLPVMMPVNSVGITTARDPLTVRWTPDEIWDTVTNFAQLPTEEARSVYKLGPDAQDWKVTSAQSDVNSSGPDKSHIAPMLYRPFDIRYTYYTGTSNGFQCRPRPQVMQHMLTGKNIGIITDRLVNETFQHVLCSRHLTNDCAVSSESKERSYLFPLYLYESGLFGADNPANTPDERSVNLAPAFIQDCVKRWGMNWVKDGKGDRQQNFGPEDVFSYMYAVLHAPTYRERYADALQDDFPHLPLTSSADLFRKLCTYGDELARLHLLEGSIAHITSYPIRHNDVVEQVRYTGPSDTEPGRVWINDKQYFDGVPPELWEFHVGGYQVCEKWLKDRKGHTLDFDDLDHYQKMIAAIAETIRLMDDIDEVIEAHGGWPIA